jgi:Dyp-type peroxidase family
MNNEPESFRPEAKTALDAIAEYEPVLPKNVAIPSFDPEVLSKSRRRAGAPVSEPAAEISTDITAAEDPVEDVYGQSVRRNIQGNIIPGFNKDHQHFLFYRITDILEAKKFLRLVAPSITSMDEVLDFVRIHRALRLKLGVTEPTGLAATWVNIAFSCAAIDKLVPGAGDQFGEQSFRQGLAERSTYLGDPTDPSHPGHRSHWRVGGPYNEADVLVIIASDAAADLDVKVDAVRNWADTYQLGLIFEQRGNSLPGNLRGHEHFGFKDGVSQPGIRGKASPAPGDFITPRYLVPAEELDQHPKIFARPGQVLVWPGQFLLGEPRQHPNFPLTRGLTSTDFPAWAARGSYLVCRRLNQDVAAFWNFAVEAASRVGVPPIALAAMLVGRWPSGAPLMRTPSSDNAALAGDSFANNHFVFDDDTRPSSMRPVPGYAGDAFPAAKADMLGTVCPHFAHIRKANSRDSATDLGKMEDTLTRLILRRGIPFGPPIVGVKEPSHQLLTQERGLMFLCYGSTIEDQFEFITRRWANSAIQPNFGGHDPIIGQRDQRGDRARFIDLPTGSSTLRMTLSTEWVMPTGGGYFFAPPIAALKDVLGA